MRVVPRVLVCVDVVCCDVCVCCCTFFVIYAVFVCVYARMYGVVGVCVWAVVGMYICVGACCCVCWCAIV